MKNGIERVSPVVLHRPDMFSGSPVAESHESSRVRIPLFLPAAPSIAEQSCVLVLVHVSVNARAYEISKKFFVLVFTLSLSLSLSVSLGESSDEAALRIAKRSLAKRSLARSLAHSLVLLLSRVPVSSFNSYGYEFEEGVLRDAVEGERGARG